jgi:hypothetical protein
MDKGKTDLRNVDDKAFLDKVKSELEQLETIRKKRLAQFLFRRKIGVIGGSIITPLLLFIDYSLIRNCTEDCGAGLTLLAWGLIWGWIEIPKKLYSSAYKKEVLPDIARLFGDFIYKAKGCVPLKEFRPAKILPSYSRNTSEDYFEGEYKGTKIQFSEIHLEQRRNSGKRTYYVTVFKGLAIIIKMKENKFFGHTIIARNQSSFMEWFKEKDTGLDRANLVDPEFEKTYDVYTNDQVEARYLIDPVMIERIKEMSKIYKTKGISAAFLNDNFFILLPSDKNLFEPSDIKVRATNPKSVQKMKKEIEQMLYLIDHLNLYDPKKAHKSAA